MIARYILGVYVCAYFNRSEWSCEVNVTVLALSRSVKLWDVIIAVIAFLYIFEKVVGLIL